MEATATATTLLKTSYKILRKFLCLYVLRVYTDWLFNEFDTCIYSRNNNDDSKNKCNKQLV